MFNRKINLIIKNDKGSFDITNLQTSLNISGSYQQCARILTFDIIVSSYDTNIPSVFIPIGGFLTLDIDGKRIFTGNVFTKSKSTGKNTMTVTCFDRGQLLKKNKASYKFSGQSPKSIVSRIAKDFGITMGSVAGPNVKISRKFEGVNLYSIIQSVYTIASEKTGKNYMLRYSGVGDLDIIEKVKTSNQPIIENGRNLISSEYSESNLNMINSVKIVNKSGKTVKKIEDKNYINKFGLMSEIIKTNGKDDAISKAKKMLKDGGFERKITVSNLGDLGYISGNTVFVKEEFTGLNCLFWIDSDIHNIKDGVYTNKLTLNYINIMDQ